MLRTRSERLRRACRADLAPPKRVCRTLKQCKNPRRSVPIPFAVQPALSHLRYHSVMPRLAYIPIIFRELIAERSLPREPEPDLVMADEQQVRDYAHAGRIDGVMAGAYVFHSGQATSVICGAQKV